MIWTPGKNYRWVHGQHVASVSLASPIWTPPALTAGVHSAQLPRFGRHTRNHTASVLHAYPVLDATCQIAWRPFLLLSLIWTPYAQSHGVQFCCSSQVGRHPLSHMASAPHNLPDLDASHSVTWRPFRTASPIWTPRQSTCGVHSVRLSRFGRHPHFPLASTPHSFSNLDTSHTHRWRPFCTPIPIWTPFNLDDGVRSACLSCFGRHPHFPLASTPRSFPSPDASHSITWRPIHALIAIWTPCYTWTTRQLTCGRHATSEFTLQYPRNSAK